jgi:hypothetical protein
MKHYLLEGEINEQALRDLSAFFNENSDSPITVFLDSNGGYTSYAYAMAVIIDAHEPPVKLIALSSIKSAAAELFFLVTRDRAVLPGTTGLIHCSGRNVRTIHNGHIPDPIDRFDHSELKRAIGKKIDFWRISGLNEKQLKMYAAGKDVTLTEWQLNQMLIDQARNRKEQGKVNG